MGRSSRIGATSIVFTEQEISKMKEVLEANKGSTPARCVIMDLAHSFSRSDGRAGQKVVPWRQVSKWLHNECVSSKPRLGRRLLRDHPTADGSKSPLSRAATSTASSASSYNSRTCSSMRLEAKSARDGAWFDVFGILSYRVGVTGDPEVQVRFTGYGVKEDEWLDVYSSLRQRSIPCEGSDCVAILPGDLVLCFQQGPSHALHYDADVQDVKRRRHDARGCRCRFLVCYRHDQTLEVLPLRKICRRPESEFRIRRFQQNAYTASLGLIPEGATSFPIPVISDAFPLQEAAPAICVQDGPSSRALSSLSSNVLVVTSEGIPQAFIYVVH